MKYGKISVTLSHDAWIAVIVALAAGSSSDAELIKNLTNHDNASAGQEYLIQCYEDELKHLRAAQEEIWRRLTD